MSEDILFANNINLDSIGQLKNARLHEVNATSRASIAATLDTDNKGFVVYDEDDDLIYVWDGVEFNPIAIHVDGDIIFKGIIDDPAQAGNDAEAVSGYQYVVGAAGTLTMAGITFLPNAVVEVGDVVLFVSDTEAYVIQRNDAEATLNVPGNILLASNTEVNVGTVDNKAVTPATLHEKLNHHAFARFYSQTVNLPAGNTPVNITHNFDLTVPSAVIAQAYINNNLLALNFSIIDKDTISVNSGQPRSNVIVNVTAFEPI